MAAATWTDMTCAKPKLHPRQTFELDHSSSRVRLDKSQPRWNRYRVSRACWKQVSWKRSHLLIKNRSDLWIARDLTLEAARDAGAGRRSVKQMPPAQIKKLLDSRNEREVLEGLRRVIEVSSGIRGKEAAKHGLTRFNGRCNTRLLWRKHCPSFPRSSRRSRIRHPRLDR